MMGRILGLDVGDATIGMAVSDPLGFTAQGLRTLRRTKLRRDLEAIQAVLVEYKITAIVCGLPLNMNGTLGPQGNKVKQFAAHLAEATKLPVEFVDERLTSVAADAALAESGMHWKKRKQWEDTVAAQLILQRHLDAKKGMP